MLFAMIFAVSIYSPNLAPFACVLAQGNPIIVRNRQVFVCRRLATNEKVFSLRPLLGLRLSKGVSAVKNLSAVVGVSLRLSGNLNGLKADG